jgi:hypothetical protein
MAGARGTKRELAVFSQGKCYGSRAPVMAVTLDDVAKQTPGLVNTFFFRGQGGFPPREPYATPEREKEYPEPSMFGLLPAYGFFIRHAAGIELDHIRIGFAKEDRRPALVLEDVNGIDLDNVFAQKAPGTPGMRLKSVRDFIVQNSSVAPDGRMEQVDEQIR